MGRSIPVVLDGGRRWNSKKDAIAHFKDMLARYADGQHVSSVDAGELLALLTRYDRCREQGQPAKAGAGVSYFTRQLNFGEGWATPGFHVHRLDGTSIDFSFREAINLESK